MTRSGGSGAAIALLVNSIANRGIQDSISCITCTTRIFDHRYYTPVELRVVAPYPASRDQRDTQAGRYPVRPNARGVGN
jgi:hypothetical protein